MKITNSDIWRGQPKKFSNSFLYWLSIELKNLKNAKLKKVDLN
jgi:hypothetical protein